MINRFTSRLENIGESFLNARLKNALKYDRIAGYFSSSIIEIAGEAIDTIKGNVRVICNSDLDVDDVVSLSAAHHAMRTEWCSLKPEEKYKDIPDRLKKLYDYLKSGKIQVKVIPNQFFGLIHGKAGIISLENGKKTAFLGSMNETFSGWSKNYELAWEDDSEEALKWVQDEFDYLWNNPNAKFLADFIVEDIKRISVRKVVYEIENWKKEPEPAATVIESPVYRKEFGLWEHQKYFVQLAFNAHKSGLGARFVLADMVGLGKTVQLALSAQLMALIGDKPILVIAPKTLLWQWQDELNNLLDMPSAVWNGKEWIDENGIVHPSKDDSSIRKCPRRVGIISQGLITAGSSIVNQLLIQEYECIIVDESHRARRKKMPSGASAVDNSESNFNNLLSFLVKIAKQTKSMLLATATPVQIHPIEAWDLLNILSQNNDFVLGNQFSKWKTNPLEALNYITHKETIDDEDEYWNWIRNPLPSSSENPRTIGLLRNNLNLNDTDFVLTYDKIDKMNHREKSLVRNLITDEFILKHNPFIRHIVRRTRDFLENTINPESNEPYLKRIGVKLFGESDEQALSLSTYLQDAYDCAEEFSKLLQQRIKSGGFIKTLLLKRVGSTMIAGKNTAEMMLNSRLEEIEEEEDYFENVDNNENGSTNTNLTSLDIECLRRFISILENHIDEDPKYNLLIDILLNNHWLDRGCIVFSQYFDSIEWIARKLTIELPMEKIGLYAGGDKSGIYLNGEFQKVPKEELKKLVKHRQIKLLLGTDAASEGLNLQSLSTLINLDLPWNPTRLEQRKGRIQRIGQIRDEVWIYNMRYRDSVEDKVHKILSSRLQEIHGMFGQIPDVLEDVWINVALDEIEEAERVIEKIPEVHPFEIRYEKSLGNINWEGCSTVLDSAERKSVLSKGW